jgi:hypothetical protein
MFPLMIAPATFEILFSRLFRAFAFHPPQHYQFAGLGRPSSPLG